MTGEILLRRVPSVPRAWDDPARWARTVLARAGGLVARGPSLPAQHVLAHTLTGDGELLMSVPAGTGLDLLGTAPPAGGSPIVVVEAVDLCPLAVPDRVRGHLYLAGPVHRRRPAAAGPWPLALEIQAIGFADPAGRADPGRRDRVRVSLEDFLGTCPDPMTHDEAAVLGHLAGSHPGELARLGARAGLAGPEPVVPLALDSHGLTLRYRRPAPGPAPGAGLVRLEWPTPLRHPGQLPCRLSSLARTLLDQTG